MRADGGDCPRFDFGIKYSRKEKQRLRFHLFVLEFYSCRNADLRANAVKLSANIQALPIYSALYDQIKVKWGRMTTSPRIVALFALELCLTSSSI